MQTLRAEVQSRARTQDLSRYQGRPTEYAREVLGITTLSDEQQEILRLLHVPPFKVEVPSGHDTGKTFVAAVAANYWHDCFSPGIVLTTAPTYRDVVDLLWAEIRLQRRRAVVPLPMNFPGERAPEMRTSEEHYAKGFTARRGETFKGRHRPRMLFIFDEANEIEPSYFETTRTMFDPDLGHSWLVIYNPTSTVSQAYQEDQKALRDGSWHRVQLSALNHPNIKAELRGEPKPIPGAVSKAMVTEWVEDWCDPLGVEDREATDICWEGQWYRPSPVFQSRVLGCWPSQGSTGVWSEALWQAVTRDLVGPVKGLPEMGCDVARYGRDWTVIVVRLGPVCVHLERHNGWDTKRIAARLRELARQWGPGNDCLPEKVPVKVDDDGVGGGVLDQYEGYNFLPVNAARVPMRPDDYPNVRSELWFLTVALARRGLVNLSRLPRDTLARLQTQAMAPEWKLDAAGRRVVEPKDATREKLGGDSPDEMDALNLAFYPAQSGAMKVVTTPRLPPQARPTLEQRAREQQRRGGHGRR